MLADFFAVVLALIPYSTYAVVPYLLLEFCSCVAYGFSQKFNIFIVCMVCSFVPRIHVMLECILRIPCLGFI